MYRKREGAASPCTADTSRQTVQTAPQGESIQYSRAAKTLFLFYIGFTTYIAIEVIYRRHSHWTMGMLGGICFLLIGRINRECDWGLDLLLQMLLAAGIASLMELIAGLILNIWLGLGIWDYSNLRYNLMGQISLRYSLLWIPLSLLAIFLDDWLRYFLFHEEKPHYVILGIKLGDWGNDPGKVSTE